MTLGRTQTELGAFHRRVAFRIGKAKAVTATARKLAILVYRTLTHHLVYVDPGADAYDAHERTRVMRRLRQRAEHLGFGLINLQTGEVVDGPNFLGGTSPPIDDLGRIEMMEKAIVVPASRALAGDDRGLAKCRAEPAVMQSPKSQMSPDWARVASGEEVVHPRLPRWRELNAERSYDASRLGRASHKLSHDLDGNATGTFRLKLNTDCSHLAVCLDSMAVGAETCLT